MLDADPQDYNPPLTRWGHLWRTVLCLAVSGLAWWELLPQQWNHHPGLFWLDLAGGVASFVLVFFRRRWPFGVAMAITVIGLFSASAAGPGVLAYVSLATRRRIPQILAVGATSVVVGQVFYAYQPDPSADPFWLNIFIGILLAVAFATFGMYIGSRRELIWTLQERARQAEAEQELRMDQARSAERERIAREMHDVLAHRISLVTMHAGALAYRTDLPPEQVRETAELIQAKAHEALTDLRQVLGVLRADDRGTPGTGDRPQPTLDDLARLLEESRDGGMVVDLADGLAGRQPAEQVGRTLYRIVQEGLTNARKHAPRTHVTVRLDGDPESGATVVVRNAKPVGVSRSTTPGSGLGLVGLRERAALAGGTLVVEDTRDAFVLRGWLPWSPTTP
ncbi:sensor histidine kinase [Marmoricola sp. RAF53]|uniref:sensor histidine kinase n=1 Tax=Marmoricola sp. RAF53 TaxID=3233059 RepID=UPI003F9E86D0